MRLIVGCLALALAPPLLVGRPQTPDLYEGMTIQPAAPGSLSKNAEVQPRVENIENPIKVENIELPPKVENAETQPKIENVDLPTKVESYEFLPKVENLDGQSEEEPACHLDQILPRTNKRLLEFVQNVNRITATEVLLHERLNKDGKPRERIHRKFNYVVVIQDVQPNQLILDEYRNGNSGNFGFPGDIATMGMPALALIFHPSHRDEFEMTCEGLSAWHGRQVYQVHFSQRKDKPARMSTLRVGGKSYPVLLMGTAWIDSRNFQIVHLETDLLQPIPQVRLVTEHQELDYGPVRFDARNVTLWLPKNADIILDSGGKRFHHRHTFTDYQIFYVDYGEQIASPKQELAPGEPAKLPM